jgi:hypothetical protein
MRYFDGQVWTNHFHQPGTLPDIGSWFRTTFSSIGSHWQGIVPLAIGLGLIGNLVIWFGLRSALGDLALVEGSFENFNASAGVILGAVFVFGLLWQCFGWIALNRYMQRAHHQASPTIADALQRAVQRLPRMVGLLLGGAVVIALPIFLLAAISIAVPALGVLLIFVFIGFVVWASVKISFVVSAVAAAPAGTSVVQASAGVSRGRFWATFGRILIVGIGVGIGSSLISSAFGKFGSVIDQQKVAELLEATDFDNIRFADLLASPSVLITALIVSTVVRAVASVVSTSAYMRLYLDAGAPSDL